MPTPYYPSAAVRKVLVKLGNDIRDGSPPPAHGRGDGLRLYFALDLATHRRRRPRRERRAHGNPGRGKATILFEYDDLCRTLALP